MPVEIYHLKAASRRNWSKAEAMIARIAAARAKGLDVGADMYPCVAGSTGLTAILPPSASAGGRLFDRLADPAERAKIRAEVLEPKTDWENMGQLATPENILVLELKKPQNKMFVGKRLSEIAEAMHKHWLDAAMDLILSERERIGTVYFMMNEENIKLQLRQPWIKFGTDASGADPDHPQGLTHPRSYGTFPRILGKYVRVERVIPLEDAIRKMTSAVAARLSIRDRGLVREGFGADVVVFDPETIADRATFERPHQTSLGVHHVFVNGAAVVRNGKLTGAKPGKIVRGPGYIRQQVAATTVANGAGEHSLVSPNVKLFGESSYWISKFRERYMNHIPFRQLDTLVGNPSPHFQRWLKHRTPDEYLDAMVPAPAHYARMDLPILTITGHYDGDQDGAMTYYRRHMEHGSQKARARHFLLIGPWDHAGTRTPAEEVGGVKFGKASIPLVVSNH